MKAYYDNQPSKLEKIGNGSYFYRFNIQKIQLDKFSKDQWVCDEVVVWEPITSNSITKAVITEKWDSNYEQKLINDFNAANLNIVDNVQEKISRYEKYLQERKNLKDIIDSDCKSLGIE